MRGTTLYRRQLLVRPDLNDTFVDPGTSSTQPLILQPANCTPGNFSSSTSYGFYGANDLSVHAGGAQSTTIRYDLSPHVTDKPVFTIANSLGDLTKRENRFMHLPLVTSVAQYGFPHDVRGWGVDVHDRAVRLLRLFRQHAHFWPSWPAHIA